MPAPPAAPGKPKDPSQMSLRRHKRQWNTVYKDFSQKIKAFKNGLNGKGDTKFQLPPSDIKFPFPNEVGNFLDTLAAEFQAMVNDAHSIMQEQETYSRVRRKRKPKPAPTAEAPPVTPTGPPVEAPEAVVDTLSRLGSDYETMLEVYSSSRLSRFWQYTKAPFSRKPYNKQRISLLSLSADLYYQLLDFENEILSLKLNSIPKSLSRYQAARYTFDSIRSTIVRLVEAMEGKKDEKGNLPPSQTPPIVSNNPTPSTDVPESPTPPSNDIKRIEQNLHIVHNIGLASQEIMEIHRVIQDYYQETDEHTKAMFKDQILKSYRKMMKSVVNEVQKRFGPADIKSPQDVINLIMKNRAATASTAADQIVKEGHNHITRFLKRQLIKARSYNQSAGPRLEVVETLEETKKLLKKFMDYLEKGLDPEELSTYLAALDENFKTINNPLSTLITMYEQEFYKQEGKKGKGRKGKGKEPLSPDSDLDSFTDVLLKRKVKRDIQKGLL